MYIYIERERERDRGKDIYIYTRQKGMIIHAARVLFPTGSIRTSLLVTPTGWVSKPSTRGQLIAIWTHCPMPWYSNGSGSGVSDMGCLHVIQTHSEHSQRIGYPIRTGDGWN